jgi:acetyl-CoA synthetase
MEDGRDLWYHDLMADAAAECEPEAMKAEDPLFILYTSGSTGKPKGVVHTTGGYLLHTALTHKFVFDYKDGDIYWCTADIGWVTGHSYIVYGPLTNGATSLMFEGVPTYPDAGPILAGLREVQGQPVLHGPDGDSGADPSRQRMGREVRSFRACESWVRSASRSTPKPGCGTTKSSARQEVPHRRHLVADRNGRIHDHAAARGHDAQARQRLASVLRRRAGPAARRRHRVRPNEGGKLCIKKPWPGMMRTMWGDHERFIDTLLHDVQRPVLHRRRLPHRRRRRLLADGPHRRRGQRLRSPHRHGRSRERAGQPRQGRRSRGGPDAARNQGPRPVRLRDAWSKASIRATS